MLEIPIKLFSTLADRYPDAEDADIAVAASRAVISLLPIGGPINEVLSLVLSPSLLRRRDEWFREVAETIGELLLKSESNTPEKLAQNELFVSALIQASRVALGTHQKEKRQLLRNILVKIGMQYSLDEDLQFMYLRYVEQFTPSHVAVLEFLWRGNSRASAIHGSGPLQQSEYSAALDSQLPVFKGRGPLVERILADLRSQGMCTAQSLTDGFQQQVMTNQGIQFLMFVLAPEDMQ